MISQVVGVSKNSTSSWYSETAKNWTCFDERKTIKKGKIMKWSHVWWNEDYQNNKNNEVISRL